MPIPQPSEASAVRPRARLARFSALATLIATAAIAVPASAQAAPAEVISRATSTSGPATGAFSGAAGAVSNDGRWAAFSTNPDPSSVAPGGVPDIHLYVRDVRDNRTHQITHSGLAAATGFDNAGTHLAYTVTWFDGTSAVYVLDLTTGASVLASRADGPAGAPAQRSAGLISGDGRSVIFTALDMPGSGPGIYRRTLATSRTTRLGDLPAAQSMEGYVAPPSPTSVSDDGRVAAFEQYTATQSGGGLIVTPLRRLSVDGPALVSGNGRTAAFTKADESGAQTVRVRQITSGRETTLPVPARKPGTDYLTRFGVTWINRDGSRVAVAPFRPFLIIFEGPPTLLGQVFDRGTGLWTTAGPFAQALYAPGPGQLPLFSGSPVSRNGIFSAFSADDPQYWYETGATVAVANLTGGELPGGTDHPPASVYLHPPTGSCKSATSLALRVGLAPPYLEPATSLTGSVSLDGKYGGEETFTKDGVSTIPLEPATKVVSIKVTASYAGGSEQVSSLAYRVHDSPDC